MVSLKQLNPDVYAEFLKGNFVVKKSKRALSAVAIDQAHGQNNASMKGDSVVVSLPENPADLRCWMVSGPDMARSIQEFEESTKKRKDTDGRRHEQKRHAQIALHKIWDHCAKQWKRWGTRSLNTAVISLS
ncbi:hypothetical protein HOLleu_18861 [Holothuria leucospilota]|uniref:Uncharacterized protein n=1 Tax=Holothuria leucospilota TaxID=206669 RepID=A0A9Q1H9G1_HOLLE|nr:hypothetical protein HOLleu_18861 [Holothuria leucospilota]